MGLISLIIGHPLVSLDIKMTNNYANSVGERGKKIGVRKSPVGIGKRALTSATFGWLMLLPAHFFTPQESAPVSHADG